VIGIDPRTKLAWRPQVFGPRRAGDIEDALVEPLWTGLRVLAHVERGRARLVDGDGTEVGPATVAAAIADATLADTTVLDGYLTEDLAAASPTIIEPVEAPSAGEQARQLVFGRAPDRPELRAIALANQEGAVPPRDAAKTAFVAVDVLEIDDEPLLDIPLLERKRLLESVVAEADLVRVGIHVRPPVDGWVTTWRAMGFRALAYKAANSRYEPGQPHHGWALAPMPRR
jgi:ATP-dependent DNA ligase